MPAACEPGSLALRVTGWSGAAGHRIATVELENAGSVACLVYALARPQLAELREVGADHARQHGIAAGRAAVDAEHDRGGRRRDGGREDEEGDGRR